jgi:hypothetical protein
VKKSVAGIRYSTLFERNLAAFCLPPKDKTWGERKENKQNESFIFSAFTFEPVIFMS